MKLGSSIVAMAASALLLVSAAFAQNAISAKAGMVNSLEGDVFLLDGKGSAPVKLDAKPGELASVKEGQILKVGEGRTEILLTPGSFLRMMDDTSFKLISSRLSDVRFEALAGGMMLEAMEMIDGNTVTALVKDATATVTKGGLYRFDTAPARIRVHFGEATVSVDGKTFALKQGNELTATAKGWVQTRFDAKETDALYRWSKRRTSYIAMANVSAARTATGNAAYGQGLWAYNPYFGFATYLPYSSTLRSPFGYYFYTPSSVYQVLYPPYGGGYGGGGGYRGPTASSNQSAFTSRGASGSYGGSYSPSAPVAAHSSVSAAPVSSGGSGGAVSASSGHAASSGGSSGGGARGGSSGGRGN